MKINDINPMIVTDSPEEMLPLYVKTMGFEITDNLEFPNVNLLVLENGRNRIDIVVDADPKARHFFDKEYYGCTINVEDYDKALYELLGAGCKMVMDTVELEDIKLAVVEQPNGLKLGVLHYIK